MSMRVLTKIEVCVRVRGGGVEARDKWLHSSHYR